VHNCNMDAKAIRFPDGFPQKTLYVGNVK
jgi:hypothetical protein